MGILTSDDIKSTIETGRRIIRIDPGTVVTPLAREIAELNGLIIMEEKMRKSFMAGNWKMNMTNLEAVQIIKELKESIAGVEDVDVVVAPPYTALSIVGEMVKGTNIELSAQNLHFEKSGAYTGEVSADMLLSCGCSWVIIGHSERRQYFGCTDDIVNKKLKAAAATGLKPIVCIGESLEEREQDLTFKVLERQLSEGLKNLSQEELDSLTVAYEPVWAIGTGKTATPEQAEEAHVFIRSKLSELYGELNSQKIRILYGGSVKPENVKEIMAQPNVDGALVGGASLKSDSFTSLVKFKS